MSKGLILMSVLLVAVTLSFASEGAVAQRRDCFTDPELELVRDAQDIDLRLKVLTHAIDRRFAVLKIAVNGPVSDIKESDKWGTLPEGTRPQLLKDIERILQKAIDDIEDTSVHAGTALARTPENTTKKDKVNPPFVRALRLLLTAAVRYKPVLASEIDKMTDLNEKNPALGALDLCDQIIDAISKLPAAQPPTKKP